MLPILTSEGNYDSDSVEVYHPVGNTDSPTGDPERTGHFGHMIEEGVIPTEVRHQHDEKLAAMNEDVVRLAYEGNLDDVEDYKQFIERNDEELEESGRFTKEEFKRMTEYGLLPVDSGPSSADPRDLNTVTVYNQRQDAIMQSEDKYRGVGGLCEIQTPREVLTGLEEGEERAAVIGSIPMQYVEKIYVAQEEQEPDMMQELESQDWDLDIDTFPEDLARW